MLKNIKLVLLVILLAQSYNAAIAQGNDCMSAVPVTPGVYTADGPTAGFGATNLCHIIPGGSNADWYSYTPPNNGFIDVSSCMGIIDTRLAVFDGGCSGLMCLDSDDDGCTSGTGSEVLGIPVVGGSTYYIEWDDFWSTASFAWSLTYHDCEAPEATFQTVNDCPNLQFNIEVDITNMGTALTVDILNDGGAPTILGATLGTHTIGPFPFESLVTVTIAHDSDAFCDLEEDSISNNLCPIISCGPDNYTYCYVDRVDTAFLWQAASSDPLSIQFISGDVEPISDGISVYDGNHTGAPILFSGDNGGDLSGLTFVSTNPDGFLLMIPYSDGSISCGSGSISPLWDWNVACLDCAQPVSTFEVIEDCAHKDYYVEVDITDLGDATSLDIVNDIGISPILGVGIGIYQVGPVTMNSFIEVSLIHNVDPLCSISSGDLIAYDDSCDFRCGNTVYEYCYLNNDSAEFLFGSGIGMQITMQFYQGRIAAEDQLVIYNGNNSLSAVLFNSVNGYNMQGVTVQSNNPDGALLMRLYSNGDVSCDDGGVSPELEWIVGCGAVGVEEQPESRSNILVYPNPSSGSVSIQYDLNNFQDIMINVIDEIGRIVYSKQILAGPNTIIDIDLNFVENGVYFIKLDSSEESLFEKLIIRQ